MNIHSARHPKIKKWKELYAGDDRNCEYFVTDSLRMLKGAVERGLLTEFVIHEKVREYGLFEDMDRTWISEEAAAEIGMDAGYWFAVVKKPKLKLEKFERISSWGAMWESNPRITGPQSAVLTTSPITPFQIYEINLIIDNNLCQYS